MEAQKPAPVQPQEAALIEQVLAGNHAAFEVLVRRYNGLLYRIARTHGLNHEDAEDLMQDVHFAAYCQLKNFRGAASYKTWLAKIALHQCYHKLHFGYLKYEHPGSETMNPSSDIMQTEPNNQPERMLANKELAKVLEESLQDLPPIYKSVFLLREMEGFSVAETASLLDITPVNVKVRLNRSKTLLRKRLESVYSSAEIFEFHLRHCDKIVQGVFARIEALH